MKAFYAKRLRMKLFNKQHRNPTQFQDTQKSESQEKQSDNMKSDEAERDPDHSKETDTYSIAQKIDELMTEKAKLLYEHGVFTWKKSVLIKHREINEKLEVLGVYQGRKPDQTDSGCG